MAWLGLLGASASLRADSAQTADAMPALMKRLREAPLRWQQLRAPLVPASGKPAETVVGAASKEEMQAARDAFVALLRTPDGRPQLLAQRAQKPGFSELDLWLPLFSAEEQTRGNPQFAARIVECWLELAEYVGRRDVLLRAASSGLQLTRLLLPARETGPLHAAWAAVPTGPAERREAALILDDYAEVLRRQGKYADALAAHRRARANFAAIPFPVGVANTWQGEAETLVRLEKFDEALRAYRQARALYESEQSQLGTANAWQGEAELLYLMNRQEEALATYRRARALYQNEGSQRGQGNTWNGEADTLFMLARYEETLTALRTARQFFLVVNDTLGQANSWRSEGEVLFRLGQLEPALQALQKARPLFEQIGSRHGLATSWHEEGKVLFQLGRTAEALQAHRTAREIFTALDSRLGQANAWEKEGDIVFFLGRLDDALEAYRTARQLFVATKALIGQGNSWHGEARVMLQQGKPVVALRAEQAARSLYQQAGDLLGEANSWLEEADLLAMAQQNSRALQAARRALGLYQRVNVDQGVANTYEAIAYILADMGRSQEAIVNAEQAVKGAQKVHANSCELASRLALIQAYQRLWQLPAAVREAEAALPLLRHLRLQGIGDEDRTSIVEWSLPYDVLIPHYARQRERELDALALAEAAHAPVLLDLLALRTRAPSPGVRSPQALALQAELARVDERLRDALGAAAAQRLQQQRRALEAQLGRLRFQASVAAPIGSGEPLDANARRALIEQLGPIVLFYTTDTELVSFLLLPGRPDPLIAIRKVGRQALRELATDLRGRLADPRLEAEPDTPQRLRAAADLLFGPFANALAPYRGRHTTLVPHGPLHQLPFEALPGLEGRVSVVPSLSVLAELRRRPRGTAPTRFALLAAGTGLNLDVEVTRRLADSYGPKAIVKTRATFADYLAAAPQAQQLLLTTHGYHVQNNREETYLELDLATAEGGHDRRLRASEIATIPLQAELVVLAACESARGEALISDERLDLSRAFLTAGARAVLATRWQLPAGAATQRFLLDLHTLLAKGDAGQPIPVGQAVARARQLSRERGDPGAVWAAFVLIGDPG